MINGIMTLSGAWHKLRDDPILKFMIVLAVVLRHVDLRGADDVDQTVKRCRTTRTGPSATCTPGALGWVGFISMGAIYYLLPRLYGRSEMHSMKLVTRTSGSPPSASSCTSRDVDRRREAGPDVAGGHEDGTLTYPSSRASRRPIPSTRSACSAACCTSPGICVMGYNVYKTVRAGKPVDDPVPAALAHA